jgi:hypothetical protein
MHYISVKQEQGVPGPGQLFEFDYPDITDRIVKRKKIVEVIDLCDSDNESTEGNPPGSSSAGTPDPNPNDDKTNVITSNATHSDIPAMQSRPEPGTRLLATSQARTSSKSKMLPGMSCQNLWRPFPQLLPLRRPMYLLLLDRIGVSDSMPRETPSLQLLRLMTPTPPIRRLRPHCQLQPVLQGLRNPRSRNAPQSPNTIILTNTEDRNSLPYHSEPSGTTWIKAGNKRPAPSRPSSDTKVGGTPTSLLLPINWTSIRSICCFSHNQSGGRRWKSNGPSSMLYQPRTER